MANNEAMVVLSIPAGEDLSSKIYRFVELASDGEVLAVASAGGNAIGVNVDNSADAAGKITQVAIAGRVQVEAGGTVTAGDIVQSDNAGKALTAAASDRALGRALTGGADGEIIEILVNISQNIEV